MLDSAQGTEPAGNQMKRYPYLNLMSDAEGNWTVHKQLDTELAALL